MEELRRPFKSWPMQNARDTLIAISKEQIRTWYTKKKPKHCVPHPRTPVMAMANVIAQGTAVAALDASLSSK
jgi:hypothetical protein